MKNGNSSCSDLHLISGSSSPHYTTLPLRDKPGLHRLFHLDHDIKIALSRIYDPFIRANTSWGITRRTDLQPPLWQQDPESDPERIFLPPHSLGARRADRQVLDQWEDLYGQCSKTRPSDFCGVANSNSFRSDAEQFLPPFLGLALVSAYIGKNALRDVQVDRLASRLRA